MAASPRLRRHQASAAVYIAGAAVYLAGAAVHPAGAAVHLGAGTDDLLGDLYQVGGHVLGPAAVGRAGPPARGGTAARGAVRGQL